MRQAPGLPGSQPAHPDYIRHRPPRRGNTRRRSIIGEYCPPADCPHPVEARVWPDTIGYVARCRDCGMELRRYGTWEIAP